MGFEAAGASLRLMGAGGGGGGVGAGDFQLGDSVQNQSGDSPRVNTAQNSSAQQSSAAGCYFCVLALLLLSLISHALPQWRESPQKTLE